MKHIAALAASLVVAAASPGWARTGTTGRDGEVKAVSVLPAPGSVEVVVDLQGAVDVQDFTLASPARLVLDLKGARLVAPATLYDGRNRGGIKNIRFAQFRPEVVRVVIDLDVLKDYRVEKRDGQIRVRIGTERTAFESWSSRTADSRPAVADASLRLPPPGPPRAAVRPPGWPRRRRMTRRSRSTSISPRTPRRARSRRRRASR